MTLCSTHVNDALRAGCNAIVGAGLESEAGILARVFMLVHILGVKLATKRQSQDNIHVDDNLYSHPLLPNTADLDETISLEHIFAKHVLVALKGYA